MNKFINLFLDISPSLAIVHYGFLPRTSYLNGLFMENEYIHIIFDDHELHALWSLGTRCALDSMYCLLSGHATEFSNTTVMQLFIAGTRGLMHS